MTKYAFIFSILALSACVSEGDKRPAPYVKAETLLQQGLEAYQRDDFTQASEKFTAALQFYQSFDNAKGRAIAQLNLIETALAMNDDQRVQQLLTALGTAPLDSDLQTKRRLLEVKWAWQQQQYAQALEKLKPLLARIDPHPPLTDKSLNLLAMQAELELLNNPHAPSAGLGQLQAAFTELSPVLPYYQAVLNRLLAKAAFNQQRYPQAVDLLTQALHYYQVQAKRRTIANCLEELAAIYIVQRQGELAKQHLSRALIIRDWLKDTVKSQRLKQQLQSLEQR